MIYCLTWMQVTINKYNILHNLLIIKPQTLIIFHYEHQYWGVLIIWVRQSSYCILYLKKSYLLFYFRNLFNSTFKVLYNWILLC